MAIKDQQKINKINAKYCDRLLGMYQDFGLFYHRTLRTEQNITISLEDKAIYGDNGLEWYPTLTGFMIINGYFLDHEIDMYFSLTEKGNLAKELGGHEAYRKYREKEINVIRNQHKVNNWLIGATILAGLSPIFVELVKGVFANDKPLVQPVPSVVVKIDTALLNAYIEAEKSKVNKPSQSSPLSSQSQKKGTIPSR
jgi:hypothetical protein